MLLISLLGRVLCGMQRGSGVVIDVDGCFYMQDVHSQLHEIISVLLREGLGSRRRSDLIKSNG